MADVLAPTRPATPALTGRTQPWRPTRAGIIARALERRGVDRVVG